MSLQVWLPLTKDLRQQGLSGITVTNNGATYSSADGKLGGSYTFSGSNSISIPEVILPSQIVNWSFACWFKLANTTSTAAAALFSERTGGNANGYTIFIYPNNSKMLVDDGVRWTVTPMTFSANTWYHLVVTRSANGKKIYIDGELKSSTTTIGNTSAVNTNGCLIGLAQSSTALTTGTQGFIGSLNDVRIYDHCLSPMEVKELAKGLVLHYLLNRQGWGQENLFTEGYWSYGSVWNVKNLINSTTSTIKPIVNLDGSCTLTGGDASNSQCYCANSGNMVNLEPNTTYTISLKITANGPCNFRMWWYDYDSSGTHLNTYSTNSQTIPSGTTKIFSVTHTTVTNTAKCYWELNLYGTPSTSTCLMHAKSLKLEKGSIATPWCPNSSDTLATTMGLNSTTEYDCSGFCNNGSKMTDTITYTSDTAKYAVSTHFNGTYDGILIENLQLSDIINTAVTYAFWIKPESESGARSVYFGSYSTGPSWSIEKTAGNLMRSYWNGSPDETCSGATITDGIWQHVCLTKSGTNDIKVYINGVQKWASTATHSNLNFPTTFRIGRDTRSNDGTPYKGLMSDFRIYATALSADDVKSLYQNSAYIDSSGNVYGAVHSEV